MLRSYHSTSAPEKALRRPSVATLYPANMTFERRECPAATPGSRRRLTKLLVKRKTSSDVPPCQGCMCAQEVASFPDRGSFDRGASRRRDARPGRPLAASGRMLSEAAPRRPPKPGEQQASEGRRRLLRSVATGVVAARNRTRGAGAEWSWPASRRPGLIYR